jgi:TIR domain/HEAT repeats
MDSDIATRVFVSYVREDAHHARKIARPLLAEGFAVWVDEAELIGGARWAREIEEGITTSHVFVACFSEAYWRRERTYMDEEIVCAISNQSRVPTAFPRFIPLRLDDCEVPEFRLGDGNTIRSLHAISMATSWDDGLLELLRAIDPTRAGLRRLITDLSSKSARQRIKAADNIAALGQSGREAIPSLRAALKDNNETVRAAAAAALGSIGDGGTDVIRELSALLRRAEVYYDTTHASAALGRLGRPGLLALLNTRGMRGYAVASQAINVVSGQGALVVPLLLELILSRDPRASAAAAALAGIRDPAAFALLIPILSHEDVPLCVAAARAIASLSISHRGTPASASWPEEIRNALMRVGDPSIRKTLQAVVTQLEEAPIKK